MRRSAQILIVVGLLLGFSTPIIAAVLPCRCEPMMRSHHGSEHHGAAQEPEGSSVRAEKCDGVHCCSLPTVAMSQSDARRHSCRRRLDESSLRFTPADIQANSASAACSAFVFSPHSLDPTRVPRELSCVLLN